MDPLLPYEDAERNDELGVFQVSTLGYLWFVSCTVCRRMLSFVILDA
jgi:hypothetical protein